MPYERPLSQYKDENIKILCFRNIEAGRQARHIFYSDPELQGIPHSPDEKGFAVPEDFIPKIRKKMEAEGLKFSLRAYKSARSLPPKALKERHF